MHRFIASTQRYLDEVDLVMKMHEHQKWIWSTQLSGTSIVAPQSETRGRARMWRYGHDGIFAKELFT